jgi:UDP-N-acetylmuramyl pentapeptide phosphotransferase/UDP-N-acetylglucosamine-1-phosphate transferase
MLAVMSLAVTLIVSLTAPLALQPLLLRWAVIDHPTERSSHSRSAIRGMGLAPLLAIVLGYVALLVGAQNGEQFSILLIVLGVMLAASTLGWIEDFRGVSVRTRAAVQLSIGIAGASSIVVSTGGTWWFVPLFGIAIAAYINVANFMDGINGISGFHGLVVGIFYAVLGTYTGIIWLTLAGSLLAVAFGGFLPWNFVKGGIFLGDVGSYLLGGGIGITAVAAIASGAPVIAVLSPVAIYAADSGMTLAKRVIRGEKWFEAHKSHVYQRLEAHGLSHIQRTTIVAGAGATTATLGILSVGNGPGAAILCVVGIFTCMAVYLFLPNILRFTRETRKCENSEDRNG